MMSSPRLQGSAPDVGGIGRAWPGLLTLALSAFAAVTTEMLPVGLLPIIGDAFTITESQAGLLVSLYALMVALLAVPLTLATARLPRKPLLLATLASYTVSNLLVMVAPNVAVLAVGRALGGLTHALFFSVCIGYATRLVSSRNVGRALAIASAGVSGGFVLGVPLGVSLGTALGWRTAFGLLAVCTGAAFVLAALILPTAAATGAHSRVRKSRVGRMAVVIASNTLTYCGHYTLFAYISVLLLKSGASAEAIGPLLLLFGGVGLLGLLLSARHFDAHLRLSAVVIVGAMLIGVSGVAVSYPLLLAAVISAVVWNTGFGPVSSLYQTAAVKTGATSADMAGAWINATCNAGIAVGAVLGGFVLDTIGISAVAWTAAALLAAGLVIVIVARRAFTPDTAG